MTLPKCNHTLQSGKRVYCNGTWHYLSYAALLTMIVSPFGVFVFSNKDESTQERAAIAICGVTLMSAILYFVAGARTMSECED